MRCPKCRKTLDPGTKICQSCKIVTIDGSSNEVQDTDILKPRSRVSVKGLGSRMSGTSHVAQHVTKSQRRLNLPLPKRFDVQSAIL